MFCSRDHIKIYMSLCVLDKKATVLFDLLKLDIQTIVSNKVQNMLQHSSNSCHLVLCNYIYSNAQNLVLIGTVTKGQLKLFKNYL